MHKCVFFNQQSYKAQHVKISDLHVNHKKICTNIRYKMLRYRVVKNAPDTATVCF